MAEETQETEGEEIPENFAGQIARDVMVLFQKQMDPEVAAVEASSYLWKNAGTPEKVSYFVDATELWLESGTSGDKFAALSWNGLVTQSVNNQDYDTFLRMMIVAILDGYYSLQKPDIEYKEKRYSTYTSIIANTFIRMVELNPASEAGASEIFTILVHSEMDLEARSAAEEDETGSSTIPTDMQKLFDEMIDYLHDRGMFKSNPMAGEEANPNEHIEVLCERLRGTRRYVMQEVINERALEKRKKLEMELENQLASAEEIVMVAPQFTEGMAFFVQEKRYNFKYLAVEKIRMTLQLLGSITGAVYFLLGFMGVWGVHWIDGMVVCLVMLVFVRIVASRKQFQFFYPTDISKELEDCSTAFLNVMRNMSQEQLEQFLVRQIKLERNQKYLGMVPEFMKYLYAIMPDRKSMVITVDELSELVENSEIEVAKQLRGQ
ncbi:MAG: hypothetical protein QF474_07315 [SAR324 cluster bacterium]|mgnify:FL=1|jgi:hypothetical protein|nr:hypothetical protein [SAR324 cluster bacterium]|tara:strand:+ start:4500 stop:5804 length:1305 start_codon:yes stop_codon:yes gene_type:complete